jgi:lipopolysaccharide export LptBFGC system permease protein LptF
MFNFRKKKTEISTELLVKFIWVSSFLAMIFAIPPLALFLGIYFLTGELIIGAIIGFGVHFVILAFSGKISKKITKIMS